MIYKNIEFSFVQDTFPTVCKVFGDALKNQINIFNRFVKCKKYDFYESVDLLNAITKETSKPHMILLNILSFMDLPVSGKNFNWSSPLFVMDRILKALIEKDAIKASSYSDMLSNPESFDNILAELIVIYNLFLECDQISLYNQTDKKSEKNYDVRWKYKDKILRADIKQPEYWLSKENGFDFEYTLKSLIIKDIKHVVIIKLNKKGYSLDESIKLSEQVLELYNRIISKLRVSRSGDDSITEFNTRGDKLVECIEVKLNWEVRRGEFIFIISDDGEKDKDSIRRNILNASYQVPKQKKHDDVNAIILCNLKDSEYFLDEVIYGKYNTNNIRKNGYLDSSPITGELKHIDSIISYQYYMQFNTEKDEIIINNKLKHYPRRLIRSYRNKYLNNLCRDISRINIIKI